MRLMGLHISIRRASEVAEETPTLRQRVQRLEMALAEFADAFAALNGSHTKLRNQFHGSKGGRPPEESRSKLTSIPLGDKAALRRALGVVPGKPFQHQE